MSVFGLFFKKYWCRRGDSNTRPTDYESDSPNIRFSLSESLTLYLKPFYKLKTSPSVSIKYSDSRSIAPHMLPFLLLVHSKDGIYINRILR